jgi:hypothetical protein
MAPRPAGKRSKLKLQKRSLKSGMKLDDVVTAPPGDTIGPDAISNHDPHVVGRSVTKAAVLLVPEQSGKPFAEPVVEPFAKEAAAVIPIRPLVTEVMKDTDTTELGLV